MKRALGLVVVLAGCNSAGLVPRSTLAPVAVMADDGSAARLEDVARGRPLVVELFATWCDSCREQSGRLSRLAARYGDRLAVIGVDVGERPGDVARVLAGFGATYPIYFDTEFRFADSQGVSQLPVMLVIDRAGTVRHVGRSLDAEAEAVIGRLVAE